MTRELDQASSEKIQSAQYGLVLLEEKGHLKSRCEDLEVLYENTRHELDITLEVSVCERSMIAVTFAEKQTNSHAKQLRCDEATTTTTATRN